MQGGRRPCRRRALACEGPAMTDVIARYFGGRAVTVTGGAGFIGSEVTHQLAAAGARASVVDNLRNGKEANLAEVLSPSVRLVVADIRDLEAMRDVLRNADIVLHLACLGVRHSIHSPLENHEVNATATLSLLELCRELGVPRFVYVSSSEIYGTASFVPMTEDHPVHPNTVYGASKLAGERYTEAYWRTYDLETAIVRPFNAFGPRSHHEGDSGEVIPKFMLRAMAGEPMIVHGDGAQTRDFTDVRDTARGILMAAASEEAVGEVINLGQGKEISINRLAELIGSIVGRNRVEIRHVPARPGDVLRLYSDSSRAREKIGYSPQIGFEEGLSNLRDWYESLDASAAELLEEAREMNWTKPS